MVDSSSSCLDRVVPEGMSQVSRQLEVRNHERRTLNIGYVLAFLRELSHVPRSLTEIAEAKQERKNEPYRYFVPHQKKGMTVDPHVSNLTS